MFWGTRGGQMVANCTVSGDKRTPSTRILSPNIEPCLSIEAPRVVDCDREPRSWASNGGACRCCCTRYRVSHTDVYQRTHVTTANKNKGGAHWFVCLLQTPSRLFHVITQLFVFEVTLNLVKLLRAEKCFMCFSIVQTQDPSHPSLFFRFRF